MSHRKSNEGQGAPRASKSEDLGKFQIGQPGDSKTIYFELLKGHLGVYARMTATFKNRRSMIIMPAEMLEATADVFSQFAATAAEHEAASETTNAEVVASTGVHEPAAPAVEAKPETAPEPVTAEPVPEPAQPA